VTVPIFTIITVVKDDLAGFQRTAKTVLSQNLHGFEWIVVDGSSNLDISEFITNDIRDERVKYLRQEPSGIYSAMNFAASASQGKYIWFLNAGDYLLGAGALSVVEAEIYEANFPEVLSMPVCHVTPQGWLWSFSCPTIQVAGARRYAHFNHQGTLIRLNVFESLGGFDLNYRLAADTELLDRAISVYTTFISKNCVTAFVLGGASGKNFRRLLVEMNRYRPRNVSRAEQAILEFKNTFRMFFFNSRILELYLVRRLVERRQSSLVELYQPPLLEKEHWPHRKMLNGPLLECCN
jgi:glycosyltransferase involved in cell wall biosynthesis